MTAPITEELLREAIDRVARTVDGRLFYLYLQRRLMAISTSDAKGALRLNEGERTFASKLIGLMAKGISESGERTPGSGDPGTGSSAVGDEPIIFAVPRPVSVGGPRGAGRRITEHTRVPGYDRTDGSD